MRYIYLTKTFVVEKSDKEEITNQLYEFITNKIQEIENIKLENSDSRLFDFMKDPYKYNTYMIENLINAVKKFIDENHINHHFFIKCRNYESFPMYLKNIKIIPNELDKSFHFILFFNSWPAYYFCSVDSSIVVSYELEHSETFYIDMADPSISISKIGRL